MHRGREYVSRDCVKSGMNGFNAIPLNLKRGLVTAILVISVLAFLPPPALAATPITTCQQLQDINTNLGADYYLANDIDCSCTSGWNGGAGFVPIGTESNKFTGHFDGKGYKITNLYINRSSTTYVGLFGFTGSGSEINNVSLEEVDVSGADNFVGGLVGVNEGTITNSYSTGSVSGNNFVGGLVGFNIGGTTTDSYWDTETSGQSSSAGGTGKTTEEMKQKATFVNWDFDTVWGIVEAVTYPYLQWPVIITSFAPPSPVNDTVCTWRTFNVTVNQEVNVSWYLNNSLLHTNHSITEANYTLHAEFVGENNVSAKAENATKGTAMQTWVWNVAAAPKPPVPVPVPEYGPIGLAALIGILSVVLAITTLRRRE